MQPAGSGETIGAQPVVDRGALPRHDTALAFAPAEAALPHLLLLGEASGSGVGALLERDGLHVTVEHDFGRAAEFVASSEVDLLVAEIDVAQDASIDFIRTARTFSEAPIFVISQCKSEDRIVRTLECGADDYVRAPFSPSELLARIRNALRRPKSWERQLQRLPSHLSLTSKERKLFDVLAGRPGEILSNQEISRKIWGQDQRTPQSLRYLVFTLRRKLEASQVPLRIINGWRGYKLQPDLKRAPLSKAEPD